MAGPLVVGLRYEICEAPGVGSTTSWQARVKIRDAQPASGSFTDYRRQVGRGQVTLENDYPRLSEIIDVDPDDHSNDVASTVVVYRPAQGPYAETLVAEWLVNQTPDELSESELVLNGPGMGAVMDWAIVEPWDWDGTDDFVSRFPDHIYGGRNVLVPIGESQCEPRISEFWTDATSGQWRVNVDGDTVDIDFDATASEVTTAYESLSTVTDVIVEGNGSEETPWRVTFVEPCYPTTSYTVTQNTLNAPINAGLIQLGGDVPPGWTEARPLAGNTLYGEYADFGVDTLPTPAPDGSTTGIFFDGETPVSFSFPGVQTVPSVKGGGTYQAGVYVYVDAAGSYPMRMVIRAPSEEPLVADSGWPSTSVTGQTWTLLSAADVSIPDYLDRVIFRTSYVGSANPPTIYVAGAYLREGMAAATVGQIMLDLLDDAQSDHAGRDAIDFIDADFDATNDSSGTAWPGPESVNIQRGQTYKRVLDSVLGRLGYEWDVVRSSTAGRWDLKVWGPGTRTTDYSAADSPSLLLGQDTLSGAASTALPRANAVTVEGAGQVFAHDEDAGSITAISRREAYQGDITYVENLDDWAGEVLDRFLDEAYAPRFEVADGSGPVPGVAYGLADALTVTTHRRRVTRQVESRGFTDTVQGGVRWTVQFGEAQFDSPVSSAGGFGGGRGASLGAIGPVAEGVRRLLEQQDRLLDFEAPSTVLGGGGGGMAHKLIVTHNSHESVKAKADYLVDPGNLDQMQAALDAAGGDEETVWVVGSFTWTGGTLNVPQATILRGLDMYVTANNDPVTIALGNSAELHHCDFFGESSVTAGVNCYIDNVRNFAGEGTGAFVTLDTNSRIGYLETFGTDYADGVILIDGFYCRIENVVMTGCERGIQATSGDFQIGHIISIGVTEYVLYCNTVSEFLVGQIIDSGSGEDAPVVWVEDSSLGTFQSALIRFSGFGTADCNVLVDGSTSVTFGPGFRVTQPQFVHGVRIVDSNDCRWFGEVLEAQGTTAMDNLRVEGTSSYNTIQGQFLPSTHGTRFTDYGINITSAGCTSNIVVNNDLGDASVYASGPLNDSGTSTVLSFPGGAIGDNFSY